MDTVRGKAAQKKFGKTFIGGIGTIEGGDGALIVPNMLSVSCFTVADRNAKFGCAPDELALLVQWVPFAEMYPGQTPDPANFVTFPKTFDGLPVYYMRGEAIRPQ